MDASTKNKIIDIEAIDRSGLKLPEDFYLQPDVIGLSKQLLGKVLMTRIDGILTGGIIVETEAYRGPEDRASHAWNNRRTSRTEVMFRRGGVAYVYLCYGIHHLFNVVVNKEGIPHAILVRAIEPLVGIPEMLRRRGMKEISPRLTAGPGALSKALGITTRLSGMSLQSDIIWIEDRGIDIPDSEIQAATRIGVDYAGEHAALPWRFYVRSSPWVSKKSTNRNS